MLTQGVKNILGVWGKATDAEIKEGLNWYDNSGKESHKRLRKIKRRINKEQAVGIIAALSPQKAWNLNIWLAERFLGGDTVAVHQQQQKAEKILQGEDPRVILRGPKERAFFECLLNPRNSSWVCVDGHAYSLWKGEKVSTSNAKFGKREFEQIIDDYLAASFIVGFRPNQLQAVTWIAWRRIHDSKGIKTRQMGIGRKVVNK